MWIPHRTGLHFHSIFGFRWFKVKSREVGADRVLEFKQKKFYSSVDKVTTKATQPLWKIPLVIGTAASKTTTTALLDAPEKEVKLEDAAKAAWVHVSYRNDLLGSSLFRRIRDWLNNDSFFRQVNYGATGVFRVHYDKTMLEALMPAVRDKSLPTTDRFMLHSDLVALVIMMKNNIYDGDDGGDYGNNNNTLQVKAGYASAKDLLMLTQNYVNETEYSVWQSVLSLLASLDSLLDDQPKVYEKFRRFGRELLSGIFAKLGWDAKPDDRRFSVRLTSIQCYDAAASQELLPSLHRNNALGRFRTGRRHVADLRAQHDGHPRRRKGSGRGGPSLQ